jgi:hypothetical protein
MTTRTEILDLIDEALTSRLGRTKVTRRPDGVLIVAGTSEAFAIQAMTIDAPDFADPVEFGEELVEFIRAKPHEVKVKPWGSYDPDKHT